MRLTSTPNLRSAAQRPFIGEYLLNFWLYFVSLLAGLFQK
jgi:hypothetical protein